LLIDVETGALNIESDADNMACQRIPIRISQYIQPTPTEKVCNREKAPRKNSKPSQHCTDEHNKTIPKSLEKLTSTEKQHPNTSQTHQLPIATHLPFWSFQTEAALWCCGLVG